MVITISYFVCPCVMCTTYMPGAFRGQKTMLSSPGTGVGHLGNVMGVLGIKPGSLQEQPEPALQLLGGLASLSKGAKFSS